MLRPSSFLFKLSRELFEKEADAQAFIASLSGSSHSGTAIVRTSKRNMGTDFKCLPRLPWQPHFVERLSPEAGQRPGASPGHARGDFYCLDFSSVFAAVPFMSLTGKRGSLVCDVCAAPGGKSILAWAALRPGILLCNDVIKKRLGALISNLERCRIEGAWVTSIDSKDLARLCAKCFDIVIVDAPCSGQALLASGGRSPGCFHPATINMNSNRQKRIVINSAKLIAPGGYLSYMTCTFSRRENEGVIEWLFRRCRNLKPVLVKELAEYQSHLADFPCYRLWPQQGLGAGGFSVLLRNDEVGLRRPFNLKALRPIWSCCGTVEAPGG